MKQPCTLNDVVGDKGIKTSLNTVQYWVSLASRLRISRRAATRYTTVLRTARKSLPNLRKSQEFVMSLSRASAPSAGQSLEGTTSGSADTSPQSFLCASHSAQP